MGTTQAPCGFSDVRIRSTGEYFCSKCGKVMEAWWLPLIKSNLALYEQLQQQKNDKKG